MIALKQARDMNATYGATLVELGAVHQDLVVVEADLMKASGSAPFKTAYPDRMFNVGIAEQDALGFAAGLASMGTKPFVSGFACFVSQRACDQAVNSIAYNEYNVKVIGTYAGLTSEKNGGTHISVCDVSIYRAIPRFTVIDPGDPVEYAAVLRYAASHSGPMYIRANKGQFPVFLPDEYVFSPEKALVLSEGSKVGLITSGITTAEGIKASAALEKQGISVRHVHMPCIKPIDAQTIIETAQRTEFLVTVENHTVIGGLGSAVAEVLAEQYPARLVRLGLQDHFGETAKLAYMMHQYGIDADAIVNAVESYK